MVDNAHGIATGTSEFVMGIESAGSSGFGGTIDSATKGSGVVGGRVSNSEAFLSVAGEVTRVTSGVVVEDVRVIAEIEAPSGSVADVESDSRSGGSVGLATAFGETTSVIGGRGRIVGVVVGSSGGVGVVGGGRGRIAVSGEASDGVGRSDGETVFEAIAFGGVVGVIYGETSGTRSRNGAGEVSLVFGGVVEGVAGGVSAREVTGVAATLEVENFGVKLDVEAVSLGGAVGYVEIVVDRDGVVAAVAEGGSGSARRRRVAGRGF